MNEEKAEKREQNRRIERGKKKKVSRIKIIKTNNNSVFRDAGNNLKNKK